MLFNGQLLELMFFELIEKFDCGPCNQLLESKLNSLTYNDCKSCLYKARIEYVSNQFQLSNLTTRLLINL